MLRWLKLPSRRARNAPTKPARTSPLVLEVFEDRTTPSQTHVPLDVYVMHGTEFNTSNLLGSAFGSGRDTKQEQMSKLATAAAKTVHAINPKATITNVVWPSLGDRGTPARGTVENLKQRLAALKGSHDVAVISFSAGSYMADKFVREASLIGSVRRILSINLDPTGNKLLKDGTFSPMQNRKVHNITYHDGLNPFPSFWATTDARVRVGEDRLVMPAGATPDGLKSHSAFPKWYATRVAADLLAFEQATPAEKTAAARGKDESYDTFNAPGHGTNLLLPLIERAIQAGIDKLIDEVGDIVKIVVDKPGHFLVAAVTAEGKLIGAVYDNAGKVVRDVGNFLSHLGQDILDVLNPFRW